MKTIFLLHAFFGTILPSYSQELSEELPVCQCTVERLSGNREVGRLKMTVTAQPLNQSRLTRNEDVLQSTDSASYSLYRTFAFSRELIYPYLHLNDQQQVYTLNLQTERLYAGLLFIGAAQNITDAFELLTTQVLLPEQCLQARVVFKTGSDVGEKIYLLPGSFYN
ncbi:MAG: hypothetical protein WBA23_16205 [Tunicatimonas sp.]|uniref:hypothetical protein n=1 Tax=Tunicatimonas sp. TaxID=1940096 RepID=UPI003C724603